MLTTRVKIRFARMLSWLVRRSRGFLFYGDVAEVRRLGVKWNLDLKEGIDLAIYLGCYERETLGQYPYLVRKGATVLDIGANIGVHSLCLAQIVGSHGHVYAVEPTRYAVDKLHNNLKLNPNIASQITISQCMLMACSVTELPDTVVSSWPVADSPSVDTLLSGRAHSTAGARIATLDHMVAEWGLGSVDLIKLDVDGYELDVLEGAQETLSKYSPIIIVELCPYVFRAHGRRFSELVEFIDSKGYDIFDLRNNSQLSLDASFLERLIPWGAGMNVLLRNKKQRFEVKS